MLDLASAKAERDLPSKTWKNMRVKRGTVADLSNPALEGHFSLVLCHNTLEYAVGPQQILSRIRQLITADGSLSLVVANRDAEPLRTVVNQQETSAALQLLDKNVHSTSLFGGYRRVYALEEIAGMLDTAGFYCFGVRGVRIACDFLSHSQLEQQEGWLAALALEQELITRTPHKYLARYLHLLARPHV